MDTDPGSIILKIVTLFALIFVNAFFSMSEMAIVTFNVWIQLKQVAELDTRMRITIKTDMPMMFKMMFDKKIQQGLDQAIDMLCQIPYNAI